uniref:MATH domain-containing protein n=1 Tax=Caenorhabditis tropicalis TaxID=1561998 RepID=A0A1I7UJM5_9PELO
MNASSVVVLFYLFLLGSTTSKLNEILKNVGKRYQHEVMRDWVVEGDFDMDSRYLDWTQFSDQKVAEKQHWNAESGYGGEDLWSRRGEKIECLQVATQYSTNPVVKSKKLELMKTDDRDELKFRVLIEHEDKFGVPITLDYYVEMDLTMGKKRQDVLFTIAKITQGGTCAEYGTVDHLVEEEDWDKLRAQPTAQKFLRLFEHPDYEMFGTRKLPNLLRSVHPDDTKISVCQEGVQDSVVYPLKKFKIWYKNFGFMWHPKKGDDDYMTIQTIDFKDDTIVARITMKLQMGRDENAKIHEWNFKFAAKKTRNVWFVNQLEVLCTPTVDYKDEFLRTIGDVVAENFAREVAQLPAPTQWYSSVAFVNKFTKNHGLVEFTYCKHEKTHNITLLEMYLVGRTFNMKFLKYSVAHEDVAHPAPDTANFKFTTLSSFQLGDTDVLYSNDWNFEVKWNQEDQFYYVEKMEIGCHNKVGKDVFDDAKFIKINTKK